jgi:hypothetical protein
MSFRTKEPVGDSVTTIPINTAEPYSWFIDLQNLKRTAAEKGGFDMSTFTQDRGHVWENEKFEYTYPPVSFSVAEPNGSVYQNAILTRFVGAPSAYSGFYIPASDLGNWAALQYGRMAPSVSEFSLAAFTGELREGLPRLTSDFLRSRLKDIRGVGSDYLNVKFGWEPLLADLQKLALNLLSASYGLFRPFGASHRRRVSSIPDEFIRWESSESAAQMGVGFTTEFPYLNPPPSSFTPLSTPRVVGRALATRKTVISRSIEGEFVYIPKAGFNPDKYMDRLETLMSVDITPSVLWQLTPWSWLVDWFNDIGGSISSMEAATSNRVLSTYLYAMETTHTTVHRQWTGMKRDNPSFVGLYYGPDRIVQRNTYVRKRRIRANPFGFTGTPNAALSSDQKAILGALGLTKIKF